MTQDTNYVVVTGASKGIGRATALHLAGKGYHVFAGVRNPADGEALRRESPSHLTPLLLDITDEGQIAQAREQISNVTEQLSGLVNNAGIAVPAPLEFLPIDELRHQLEVNVVGQLAVTQAFLPLLRNARGRIINITSVGGRIAGSTIGAYHASKFALEAMTDTLRQELHPWGIEVIAVEPGTIATPIWETSTSAGDKLLSRMGREVMHYYGRMLERARAGSARSSQSGLPPLRVAEVIERALSARRPKTRYLVGMDAQIGARILARLPDRPRDRIMAMLSG